MYKYLLIPGGIVTFSLILTTVLSGLKVIKLGFKWHRRLGITAAIFATCHGLLALYINFFL
jgi:hypothetical protein